ncbi:MAG: hypothetical protein RLZZ511_1826 [Cyanobacteriota bacterium]|jgi:hypothetical protein
MLNPHKAFIYKSWRVRITLSRYGWQYWATPPDAPGEPPIEGETLHFTQKDAAVAAMFFVDERIDRGRFYTLLDAFLERGEITIEQYYSIAIL